MIEFPAATPSSFFAEEIEQTKRKQSNLNKTPLLISSMHIYMFVQSPRTPVLCCIVDMASVHYLEIFLDIFVLRYGAMKFCHKAALQKIGYTEDFNLDP